MKNIKWNIYHPYGHYVKTCQTYKEAKEYVDKLNEFNFD